MLFESMYLVIVIEEKNEKEKRIDVDPVSKARGITTRIVEEELRRVGVHENELNDLKASEPRLPPQQSAILGAQRRQAVICVHDRVNEGVYCGEKSTVAAWRMTHLGASHSKSCEYPFTLLR